MLNTRALNELFSQNCDAKLCKQWWLMTPNGTLLAHSSKSTILQSMLRRQIAAVALAWQEHDSDRSDNDDEVQASSQLRDKLRTLTIESTTNNIIATRVQSQLLLVLEGGVPPRRASFEPRTTAEGPDDDQYPQEVNIGGARDIRLDGTSSRASSISSNAAHTVLRLQRRKLEAMANAIADNFEQTGFQLPDNGAIKLF